MEAEQIKQNLESILAEIPHFLEMPTEEQLEDRQNPLMYFRIEIRLKKPNQQKPDFEFFISRKCASIFHRKIICPYRVKIDIRTYQCIEYLGYSKPEETEIDPHKLESIRPEYEEKPHYAHPYGVILENIRHSDLEKSLAL